MAASAVQLGMCASQCKTRGLAMIKGPDIPAVTVVATCAALAQATLVYIVGSVATAAIRFHILELLRQVTLLAGNSDMQPDQRKIGQVVIEADLATPSVRHMALITLLTQFSGMCILRAMTADTGRTQLLRGNIGRMAGIATEFCVRPGQRKFSIARMVKGRGFPVGAVVALVALVTHSAGV